MSATAIRQADAAREEKLRQAQLLFDFRLKAGEWPSFKDIAEACGWSRDSVKLAFDNKKILGNRASMSSKPEADKTREHGRVHRDEALLFLAEIANYGMEEKTAAIERTFRTLPRSIQHELIQRLVR